MINKFIGIVGAFLLLLVGVSVATPMEPATPAEPTGPETTPALMRCFDTPETAQRFIFTYWKEIPILGLQTSPSRRLVTETFTVMVNLQTGSWTILRTFIGGKTCVLRGGVGLEFLTMAGTEL